MHAIMDSNLECWIHSPTDQNLIHYYNDMKKYVVQKGSVNYGAVLVRTKRKLYGYSVRVQFSWRRWQWKPDIEWKYTKRFHWLCFMSWLDGNYDEVFDSIIKDHCNE